MTIMIFYQDSVNVDGIPTRANCILQLLKGLIIWLEERSGFPEKREYP